MRFLLRAVERLALLDVVGGPKACRTLGVITTSVKASYWVSATATRPSALQHRKRRRTQLSPRDSGVERTDFTSSFTDDGRRRFAPAPAAMSKALYRDRRESGADARRQRAAWPGTRRRSSRSRALSRSEVRAPSIGWNSAAGIALRTPSLQLERNGLVGLAPDQQHGDRRRRDALVHASPASCPAARGGATSSARPNPR